ncbi:MAG: cytochrome P450 [Candidatus Methylomirabilales bacterium]
MSSLPPGPRMPPILQLLNWIFRPIPFMEECARRYGDWFTVRFLRFPKRLTFVFTSDPEAIKEVFAGNPDQLHAREANLVLKPVLGEHSLLLLDGPRHVQERRRMMPAFHGERMQVYCAITREVADRSIDAWPLGRPFPILAAMQEMTLGVILRMMFGSGESDDLFRLRRDLKRILALMANPMMFLLGGAGGEGRSARRRSRLGPVSPWERACRLLREVDSILLAEIAKRRAAGGRGGEDILTLLVQAGDGNGRSMSDAELRDGLVTLLVAGHETTATALSWVFYRLLRHPEVLAKLRAELDGVVGSHLVGPEHLGQLRYLDAAVMETLRLNPTVPLVGRSLQVPLRIGARDLPAGVVVAPCIYLTHRRPDLWPDPERFAPERFLEERGAPQGFFPFGGGVHRCLGMAFAVQEMKVIIAQVLSRVVLRRVPGYTARVVRRNISFAPSEGMPVIVEGRP